MEAFSGGWQSEGKTFLSLAPYMAQASETLGIPLRWSEEVWPPDAPSTGEVYMHAGEWRRKAFWDEVIRLVGLADAEKAHANPQRENRRTYGVDH